MNLKPPVIVKNIRIVPPGNSSIRKYYTSGGAAEYIARKSATSNEFAKNLVKECIFLNGKRNAINYIGRESASVGLFGETGIYNDEQTKRLGFKLAKTESYIWDNVWSLSTEFNNKHKVYTVDRAMEVTQAVLPSFFKKYGLDSENIEWFGAFHTNTDHAHVHFIFFEKNARSWNVKEQKHNSFTNAFSKKMQGNFIAAYDFLKVKIDSYIRNELKDFFWRENRLKANLVSDKVKNSNLLEDKSLTWQLVNKIYQQNEINDLNQKLLRIETKLPKTGFTEYGRLPITLQNLIKDFIDDFVKTTELKVPFEEYKNELYRLEEEMKMNGLENGIKHDFSSGFAERRLYDSKLGIYNRMGNQLIKVIKRQRNKSDFKNSKNNNSKLFTKQNKRWLDDFEINQKKEKTFGQLFNDLYFAIDNMIDKEMQKSKQIFKELVNGKEKEVKKWK